MTTAFPWHIEPLTGAHDRAQFSCGKPSLDDYIRQYARQDQRRDLGRTFVAVEPGELRVDGYYTLASASEWRANLPEEEARALPKRDVPVVLLGRLAVDVRVEGRGLGERLLLDALRRSERLANEIGIRAVIVQALDEQAKGFYRKYGFMVLTDDPLHLYLPMFAIRKLVLHE